MGVGGLAHEHPAHVHLLPRRRLSHLLRPQLLCVGREVVWRRPVRNHVCAAGVVVRNLHAAGLCGVRPPAAPPPAPPAAPPAAPPPPPPPAPPPPRACTQAHSCGTPPAPSAPPPHDTRRRAKRRDAAQPAWPSDPAWSPDRRSYLGYRRKNVDLPVRVNQIPRQVPEQVWYMRPAFSIVVGGVLPFGAPPPPPRRSAAPPPRRPAAAQHHRRRCCSPLSLTAAAPPQALCLSSSSLSSPPSGCTSSTTCLASCSSSSSS